MDELARFIRELKRWDHPRPELLAVEGKPREAVLPLCRALKDRTEWVRRRAAEVLGRLGDPRAVPHLADALKGEEWYVREQAAAALGRLGGVEAVLALGFGLEDEAEEAVRVRIVEALGRMDAAGFLVSLVPALQHALKDPSAEVRRAAAACLALRVDASSLDPLQDALTDPAADVREAAALALRALGSPAVRALCRALRADDPAVRMHAATGLGVIGDARAVPALCRAATSPDTGTCLRAAWALGAIGDRRAVRCLIEGLRDARQDLRCVAARALGEIARKQPAAELRAALPLLRQMLHSWRHEGPEAREAYYSALQQIEAVTRGMKDLPVPSSAPQTRARALPLPSPPTVPEAQALPIPSPGPHPEAS